MIQNGVPPVGEKSYNMSYARSQGIHVQQPSMKSLQGQNWAPASRMKSCFPAIVRPGLSYIVPPKNHLGAGRCGSTK
jgi:hypothetical protein